MKACTAGGRGEGEAWWWEQMTWLWAQQAQVGAGMATPAVPVWQLLAIAGLLAWLVVCRKTGLSGLLRSAIQPYVVRKVEAGVPFLVMVQKMQDPFLDTFLSGLSTVVSVEFYTAFLPVLFWSGNNRLARQMTLLMAVCNYVGNCIKDLVSAPRPPTPPVRRFVVSHAEKGAALEYGLPSSHTINTMCLSLYLLHNIGWTDSPWFWIMASVLFPALVMVIFSRLYLGMHAPVDVIGGVITGGLLLVTWTLVDQVVDDFITSGQNVVLFWSVLAVVLCFAYPTPELRTPSFEFHTAFNGVALGVVAGVHRTFLLYHSDDVAAVPLHTWAGFMVLTRRTLVGLPVILTVKGVAKASALQLLPLLSNAVGLPIHSSSYIPWLAGQKATTVPLVKEENTVIKAVADGTDVDEKLRPYAGYEVKSLDVDTGVRLLQYAGLAWSVVELVPLLFSRYNL